MLRYCAGDQNIVANGILYPATGIYGSGTIGGPYFDRKDNKAKFHQKIGIEVDTLTFDVIPGAAMIFGDPFLWACEQGQFDGATILLDRAFMATYGDTSLGLINIFTGIVAEVDCGRSLATFNVNSKLELLNENWPHNLYQAGCMANLGDATCGVDLSGYSAIGSVLGGSTPSVMYITPTASPDGIKYQLGKFKITSGTLSGLARTIRDCDLTTGTISMYGPFPSAPNFGDTFVMYFGCDKSLGAQGCPKFSNVPRFRGFPWVPQPVEAI